MTRLPDAPVCERGNDLISFLYGEIEEGAARDFERDFERHLPNCAECESQLSAFKQVRSSVVAWRQESLGSLAVSVSPVAKRASDRGNTSAVAAFRKFFELAPSWLKGSLAFASLLFCLLCGLALAQVFQKPQPIDSASEKRYTQKELLAQIEDAVRSSRENREGQTPTPVVSTPSGSNQRETAQRRIPRQSSERVATNPGVRRGPLTKAEREQLAADLRLIPQEDTDLDLLGDGSNQ